MKIHHLRSATFVLESDQFYILIDPMLGAKGSLPAFSYIRFKGRKNPLVDLPPNASDILSKVTHCLITHSHTFGIKAFAHTDHLDQAGENFLRQRKIPVICGQHDEVFLKKEELNVQQALLPWKRDSFLEGFITAIPAQHGHGAIHKMMANGSGFFLELLEEPSIYILGDTVLTDQVRRGIEQFQPNILVIACGQAQLDIGAPILMSLDEIVECVRLAPYKVICNHLEALNHCPISRDELKNRLEKEGLLSKCFIPKDGEVVSL